MAKKKKVTRKQLLKGPDEFLTFSRRLFRYVMEHVREISTGLAVIFGILIIIAGIRYFAERSENQASALLEQALTQYETVLKDEGQEKAYADAGTDFQKLLKEYGGKDAGKVGRVIYAGICHDAGDADKAIKLYKTALQDFDANPAYKNLILSGIGYAFEKKGDKTAAVTHFEKIAQGSDPLMKDEAFYNLGRLYAEMGESDKSVHAFKTLMSDYSDSLYIELVKEKYEG